MQTRTDGLKTYVSVPRTSWDKYQTHIREAVERESHAATNSLAAADNEPISGEHVQSNRPMSLQGRSMSLQTVIDADFSVDGSVKSTRRKFSKSKMAPGYRVTLDTNNTSLNLQEVESSESSQIESFAVSQIESSVFSDFESGQVLEKKYVRSDILFFGEIERSEISPPNTVQTVESSQFEVFESSQISSDISVKSQLPGSTHTPGNARESAIEVSQGMLPLPRPLQGSADGLLAAGFVVPVGKEIWAVFDRHFGPARTKPERGRRGLAVKGLLESGVSADEVSVACKNWQRVFGNLRCTEMAILSHIGKLTSSDQVRSGGVDKHGRLSPQELVENWGETVEDVSETPKRRRIIVA